MPLEESNRYKLHQPVVETDEFIVGFPLFGVDDLTVYVDGVLNELYSVVATFTNGRSDDAVIQLVTAVSGVDVEIYGTRAPRRDDDYIDNSPALAQRLQEDADRLTAVQQEQARDYGSTIRVSANSPVVTPLSGSAADRADRVIAFDETGFALTLGPKSDEVASAQGYAVSAGVSADAAADSASQAALYDGPRFDSFADLISYEGTFEAGTLVRVTSIGAAYKAVAASGNLGQSNAGGQEFDVIPLWVGATGGIVPVTFCGATNDDATDDTSAFQAAANISNSIYVPAGNYVCNAAIQFTGAGTVSGAGMGVTFITWSGSAGLFFTGVAGDQNPVTVSDITLLTDDTTPARTAINVDNSAQIPGSTIQNRTSPRLDVRNVACKGSGTVATTGWLNGINCVSVLHATVDGFHFEGKHGATQADIESLRGINFEGAGSPVEIVISRSWVFYADTACRASDCEGVFISQCNFVAVDVGMQFTAAGAEPQLNLENSHVNANVACVLATNLAQGSICSNLFYARNTATGDVTGVRLTDCQFTSVEGNKFVNTGGFDFNTVVVPSGGTGCLIDGNIFQSATTAIWLQSGSGGVRVGRQVYGSVTTRWIDDGTNNRISGARAATVLTSTKSLANGVALSAITWDTFSGDGVFWDAANPTRLTATATGKYRVGGTLVFAINGTGLRRAAIRKNGSPIVGLPIASIPASGVVNEAISLGEATIELNQGDYIEMYAAQNSGAAMTLPVAESYISMEYVWED